MTCTTLNPTGQREVTPALLLFNPQGQGVTEESGLQLGSNEMSSVKIDSRVSTMEASMKNQGRNLQGIEGLLKQLVGIRMSSPPTQSVVSTVTPKRRSGT